MQNVYHKFASFSPHRLLGLKGLSRLYIVLFYATLAVGLYAAVCWVGTFMQDPAELGTYSAPVRKIYLLAFAQALLACVGWSVLIRVCQALHEACQALSNSK